MNRLLAILCAIFVVFLASADNYKYLYLNNGNIVKGIILASDENSPTITIKTENGEVFTYNKSEIRKLGNTPLVPSKDEVPENIKNRHKDYSKFDSGFWATIETNTGYLFNFEDTRLGFVDLDIVGGYRFNEYARLGLGVGARYYIGNNDYRKDNTEWAFPIFANIRGNIISAKYRTVVPFYSFDIGTSCRDGFMIRPTIGLRIGEPRSAFILGLSYMGQSIKSFEIVKNEKVNKEKFASFFTIKLGYEF